MSRGRKALVIDDDPLIFKVMEKLLQSCGLECLYAANGAQAEELLVREGKECALAIVDMVLPGGPSGWDVLDAISGNPTTSHMPVVVLTGVDMPDDEVKKLKTKADAVVRKRSLDVDKFRRTVADLIGEPAQ